MRITSRPVAWAVLMVTAFMGCWTHLAAPTVRIDGSSTVYPITEAVAEAFVRSHPGSRVTVGFSGTGGGMQKFTSGDIDMCNASRTMHERERERARLHGIEPLELQVAMDGLAVVVHPENKWCNTLTVEQLKEIWRPESAVQKWSDLNPDWPERELKLYGPGTDSGTFDYFTEAIVGTSRACRADYMASEDDNTLVSGVQVDRYALGYFGFAFYAENRDRLRLVAIDNGEGGVLPSEETVHNGTYRPLSRPLFLYVSKASLARAEVAEFVKFYLTHAEQMTRETGYIPITSEIQQRNESVLVSAMQSLTQTEAL